MMVNDTSFNILVSYAHIGKKNTPYFEYIREQSRIGKIDLMIDSGAFSKFGAQIKGNHSMDWITLDNYCSWLDKYENDFHKYVMLDKIQDDAQSKKNYEEMLKRGHNPMYVLTTFDQDYDYLKYAIENNPEICVSCGSKSDYSIRRYQIVDKISKGKSIIHSLAFFKFPDIYRLPILSSDAATWVNGSGRFGSMYAYQGNGCIQTITGHKKIMEAFKNRNKYLIQQFKETGVFIDDLRDNQNYKGNRLPLYTGCVAFVKAQKYAWRLKKLRLYLSGAVNFKLLRALEYVNERVDTGCMNYREWLEYTNRKG